MYTFLLWEPTAEKIQLLDKSITPMLFQIIHSMHYNLLKHSGWEKFLSEDTCDGMVVHTMNLFLLIRNWISLGVFKACDRWIIIACEWNPCIPHVPLPESVTSPFLTVNRWYLPTCYSGQVKIVITDTHHGNNNSLLFKSVHVSLLFNRIVVIFRTLLSKNQFIVCNLYCLLISIYLKYICCVSRCVSSTTEDTLQFLFLVYK